MNENDGTTYVVGLLLDGKPYDLSLDAAGRVMRKERVSENDGPKTMRVDALPVKVRTTIQREAGAGVLAEVEMQEQKTTYMTEVTMGKRKYRIVVDADGVLLTKEYIGDDEN